MEVKCSDLLVGTCSRKGIHRLGNWTDLDPNPDFANYQLCDFWHGITVLSLCFFISKMVTAVPTSYNLLGKLNVLSVCGMPNGTWSVIDAPQIWSLSPLLYLKSRGKKVCLCVCGRGYWRPVIKSIFWERGNVTNSSQRREHHHPSQTPKPHDLYLNSRTVPGSCSLLHRGGLWTNWWFGPRVSWWREQLWAY